MSENLPEKIIVTTSDDSEEVYHPEPFDPYALRHDPNAAALQMQGRKPRQPTVNEAGEIIGWGVYIATKGPDDVTN